MCYSTKGSPKAHSFHFTCCNLSILILLSFCFELKNFFAFHNQVSKPLKGLYFCICPNQTGREIWVGSLMKRRSLTKLNNMLLRRRISLKLKKNFSGGGGGCWRVLWFLLQPALRLGSGSRPGLENLKPRVGGRS